MFDLIRNAPARITVVGLVCVVVAGCITPDPSPNASFFRLESAAAGPVEGASEELALIVGPIEVADYLQRPQMVRRVGEHQISYDELNRWAEPLQKSISTVLVQDLTTLLGTQRAFPFRSVYSDEVKVAVVLGIQKFEATPGEQAVLTARWAVVKRGDESPLTGRLHEFEEPVDGYGVDKMVAAQVRLLSQLSRAIAADVVGAAGEK